MKLKYLLFVLCLVTISNLNAQLISAPSSSTGTAPKPKPKPKPKPNPKVKPMVFDETGSFYDGMARVKKNGKYGFIDESNKLVVPLQYSDLATVQFEGLIWAALNSRYGHINLKGQKVTPFIYDDSWSFSDGLAKVKLNGKYGFVNKYGTEVIYPKYESAESFYSGKSKVTLNGEDFYIDKNGSRINDGNNNNSTTGSVNISDDFSSNSNGWPLKNTSDQTTSIRYGKLSLTGNTVGYSYTSLKSFNIDGSADYTVSASAKWISGVDDRGFGIDFGSDDVAQSYYLFEISANGFYHFTSMKNNGQWTELIPWTASTYIYKTLENSLKIKKQGSSVSFYINDHYVDSKTVSGSFGKDFGFKVGGGQTIEFDNFKLSSEGGSVSSYYTAFNYAFVDDFIANTNNWPLVYDNNKEVKLQNGKLSIRGISADYSYHSLLNFPVDSKKDFNCSVTTRWVAGVDDRSYGLSFCADFANNNYYSFFISGNGYYKIAYLKNGTWTDIKAWTASNMIYKNSTNTLTVKKEGSSLRFYINDVVVDTETFLGAFGSDFGVSSENKQTVEFDDFSIQGTRSSGSTTYNNNNTTTGNPFYFSDYFSSNNSNWDLVNDENKTMMIENGKLTIIGLGNYSFTTSKDFDINVNNDFTISVDVKWLRGIDDGSLGLNYASDINTGNYYTFTISANGSYIINNFQNNIWTPIKDWTSSSYIRKNSQTNTLKVKRVGSATMYYINDNLVETLYSVRSYGSGFGCRVSRVQSVEFDNFILEGKRKN